MRSWRRRRRQEEEVVVVVVVVAGEVVVDGLVNAHPVMFGAKGGLGMGSRYSDRHPNPMTGRPGALVAAKRSSGSG